MVASNWNLMAEMGIMLMMSESSEGNAPVLKYRITWKNQTNTALYSADSVVKLVNLELNGKDIIRRDLEGGAGTAGNTLYIYYTDPGYSSRQ